MKLDNVILTPHIGSATVETRYDMGKLVYDNVVKMLTTNSTISPVN
jgi:lactate dehydrogenase-like 2-hydroxyacid dehydrogenase